MKIFKHFPEDDICLMCGKNTDKECILIPIDGTKDGNICEVVPIHVDCIHDGNFRYSRIGHMFYKFAKVQ